MTADGTRERYQAAHRDTRREARAGERRARAITALAAAQAACGYCASRLGDTAGPGDLLDLAGELEATAAMLRRIPASTRAARAARARQMARDGATVTGIARALGVSDRAVRNYLRR